MNDRAPTLQELNVVSPSDIEDEPWANARGSTKVLARGDGWRLSLAEIHGDVPFSSMPGMDRWLIVVGDCPLSLDIDGMTHGLSPGQTVQFSGDAPVAPALSRSRAKVINLIVRHGSTECSHRVSRVQGSLTIKASAAEVSVVVTGTVALGHVALPVGSTLLPAPVDRVLTGHDALVAHLLISHNTDDPHTMGV